MTVLIADDVHDLADSYPDSLRAFHLDARDHAAIGPVIARAMEAFGRIDVLVNNAGYGLVALAEATGADKYRPLFEVNLFGVVEMDEKSRLTRISRRPIAAVHFTCPAALRMWRVVFVPLFRFPYTTHDSRQAHVGAHAASRGKEDVGTPLQVGQAFEKCHSFGRKRHSMLSAGFHPRCRNGPNSRL